MGGATGYEASGRDGLVLEAAPAPRCDDFRLGGANVDYDPRDGRWRMWYYCRDAAMGGPPTLGSGRIALAMSNDGVTWERVDGPGTLGCVFEPAPGDKAFDTLHLGVSDVLRSAQGWEMWYFGGSTALRHSAKLGEVEGLGMLPGYATSPDGVNWTRVPGKGPGGALLDLPAECLYRAWPNVFVHEGKRHMQVTEATSDLSHFHTSQWASMAQGSWERLDDLAWSDAPVAYDEAGIVTRQVLRNPLPEGGPLLMIYTGVDRAFRRSIALAHSYDGVRWARLYREPIFGVGAPGAWDSLGVAATRLVHAEGHFHLYYYGFQTLGNTEGMRGIGLAIAPDTNVRALRRVPSH